MKVRAYLRVAEGGRNGYQVAASTRPNPRPLTKGQGFSAKPVPTIQVAIDLEIHDDAFDPAKWPAINLGEVYLPHASGSYAVTTAEQGEVES